MNVKELLEKGWIKSEVWFDVMAVSKELTEKSLKEHIEKLKKQEGVEVSNVEFEDPVEVENPPRNVDKAYTQAAKLIMFTKDVETLLYVTIFFAPSAVEVLKPEEIKLSANSIQVIMNSVADLLHRFAAQGAGGVVIAGR